MKLTFIVLILIAQSQFVFADSNPYIICGNYQPTTQTLSTPAGQKIQIENKVEVNTKDAAPKDVCLFAKTFPDSQTKTIRTLPFGAEKDEVKAQGWSSLRCGDLKQENGQLYLITETEKLALKNAPKVQVESNGAYCVYSNKLPQKDLNGIVTWEVEKINLDGKFSSGVSVGN